MDSVLRPVFLLGNPRSGTTMMRLMMTSHAQIGIPPESEFIVRLFPRYGHLARFSRKNVVALRSDLSGDPIDLAEQWEVPLGDLLPADDALVGLSYAEVCGTIYRTYQEAKGLPLTELWGDKNNAYGQYIDVLAHLYPQAHFVHLLRDGRAVLNSYRKLDKNDDSKYAPILPRDARQVALDWSDMTDRIERHLRRYANGRWISLRYEDVLDQPEAECRRLCEFLQLDYDPGMLKFHIHNQALALEPKKYGWKANTFRPMDKAKSSSWQIELSPKALATFEEIAAPALRRHGYHAHTGAKPSRAAALRFRAEAKAREVLRHLRYLGIRARGALGS